MYLLFIEAHAHSVGEHACYQSTRLNSEVMHERLNLLCK